MNTAVEVGLPFLAVLIGAVITYRFNVRERQRTKVEDAYHDVIAAVGVAQARKDYMSGVGPWAGATRMSTLRSCPSSGATPA